MEYLAIIIFVAYLVWCAMTEERRKAEYQRTLENVGFRFHAKGGRELDSRLKNFRQTESYKNETENVVEYNNGSLQAFLFKLELNVRKKRQLPTRNFIALLSTEIQYPDFFVCPDTTHDKQRYIDGTSNLQLVTNAEDSQELRLEGLDEQAMNPLFTGPIVEFLCDLPLSAIESHNGMILYCPSSPKPVRLKEPSFLWWLFGGRRGPIRFLREEFHLSEFPGTLEQTQTTFKEVDEFYQLIASTEAHRLVNQHEQRSQYHLESARTNKRNKPPEVGDETTRHDFSRALNGGKLDIVEPHAPANASLQEASSNDSKDGSPFIVNLMAASMLYGMYAVPCWLLSLSGFEPWGWKLIPDWAHYTLVLVIPAIGIVWSFASGSNNETQELRDAQQSQNEEERIYGPAQLQREKQRLIPPATLLVVWFFYGIYSLASWLLTHLGFSPWGWRDISIGVHIGLILVLPIAAMVWLGRSAGVSLKERKAMQKTLGIKSTDEETEV